MTTATRAQGFRPVDLPDLADDHFEAHAPDWASGCPKCRFGIVGSVPLVRSIPLFEERMIQAAMGTLQFCDCRAGMLYRQYLRRHYSKTTVEYREMLQRKLYVEAA
jgi:hypothetical protein